MRKKTGRLQQIAEIIQSRGIVQAQELADLFKTSRRTIYRDIEALKEQGMNIEAYPGSNGGFRRVVSHPRDYHGFTLQETCALLLAGSFALESSELPYAKELDSALERLLHGLSASQKESMLDTLPNISMVSEKLANDEDCNEYLDRLTEAISRQQSVSITYYSLYRDAAEPREIDPYHLYCSKGVWYVIAYCHRREQLRSFRVDRIQGLSLLERHFERAASFSLHSYLGSAWSMIRGEKYSVRVRFLPPISRFIAESKWHPTQEILHLADGSVLFEAEIEGLDEFKRWVLTFAEQAEALAPRELQESIKQSCLKMLDYYR